MFVLHYSVNPYPFPQQLREVAGLMELIHLNQKEWNCDVSSITIMGFSAGGHLAAQYSNRYDCQEIREIFSDSRPVHKPVLAYPVITADERYTNAFTRYNYLGYEPEEKENTGFSCEMLVTEKNATDIYMAYSGRSSCSSGKQSPLCKKVIPTWSTI